LLKAALEGAFAAATGISNTDMAGAIREASREASGLFAKLGPVLSRMRQMAQDRADWAAWMDPGRILRAGNDERGSQRGYVWDSQAYRYQESIANRPNSGAASGGAAARDTLAALQAEAQALMAALDQQIAAINEKVALGLKTTAEGVDAVAGAKRTAAEALAELIPRIEAVAPTAKGALDQIRALVKGLVPDLVAAGATLGQQMADGFKAPFAAFIAGTKSGKAAFGDFMDFINQKIASMLAERFTNAFITPLFDSIFGAFGIAKVGAVGTAKGLPLKPMAAPSLAKGGVPWRPAILDGPGMALAPPRRPSGATDVPPYAANQSAGKWVIKLEIINKAEGVKASRGPDRMEGGSPVMQIIFEQIEGALAANIGRGVGPLNAALGGSFGLQRQGR